MGNILITIGAVLLISFIIWWFFGKRTQTSIQAELTGNTQQVEVTVDGGYTPNVVVLKQGVPATINFNRKDTSSCFSHVVFPDFGINEELPASGQHAVKIDTSKPGEYNYACGMSMFHGKVVVK